MDAVGHQEATAEFTRLHITPLRPELLTTYLGPTLTAVAKNTSYHFVQTFPDKGFGYVELPAMDAAKLKKKLNGSILKGQKISIEEARPEKRRRSTDDEGGEEADEKTVKKTRRGKKAKKAKKEDGVIQGHELEQRRKVKRGWTETPAEKREEKEKKKKRSKDQSEKEEKKDKDKEEQKKREASKYTSEPECLFRTNLPASAEAPKSEETKKKKRDKSDRKQETVIHEFANTKKHASFLKSSNADTSGRPTQEYVDGKGWVDAQGNVVEEETEKQREKRERRERKERKRPEKAERRAREEQDANEQQEESAGTTNGATGKPVEEQSPFVDNNIPAGVSQSAADSPATAAMPLAEQARVVHPLEALFKRPPKLASLDTTLNRTPNDANFSFFGGDNDSDIERDVEAGDVVPPMTPFTRADFEWRNLRSAAPTPDTAAIGRRSSFSFVGGRPEDDEDESEEDENNEQPTTAGANRGDDVDMDDAEGLGVTNGAMEAEEEAPYKPREESAFAKWFYEHRSENNKTWRAHRREAMKMKRKRENRRLTRRIV